MPKFYLYTFFSASRALLLAFSFCIFLFIAVSIFSNFSVMRAVFTLFELNLIFSAWMVVFSVNPVYSVLFLVLVFFNGAGLLFFLSLDFLGFMLLIVYVGAIAVLFLFVVMMLNIRTFRFLFASYQHFFVSSFIFFCFIFLFGSLLFDAAALNLYSVDVFFSWFELFYHRSSIESFGYFVYGPFAFDFVIALVVLLIAVVGTISLTFLHHFSVRRQDAYSQILRNFENSIRFESSKSKNSC